MSETPAGGTPAPTTERAQGGVGASRLALARPAQRRPVKARLALSGPTGSGKTWTGLQVATMLSPSRPILWIDTESNEPILDEDGRPMFDAKGRPLMNTSAELYADSFDNVIVIPWTPPYDPQSLTKTIIEAGPHYGVVGVDSGSHFWRKEGGTLDQAAGTFGGWKVARPAQDALVAAILSAPCHIIFCTRAKMDYLVGRDERDRQTVQKVGLAPVQADDLEYEFQVVGMIDENHRLDIGKTRCPALAGRSFTANHEGEFAGLYADWLSKGKGVARMAEVDAVRFAVWAIADPGQKALVRKSFADEFGPTEYLTREQMPDVWVWLLAARGLSPHPFEPVERPPEGDDPGGPTEICTVCGTTIVATWHDISAPRGAATAQPPPESAEPAQDGPGEEQAPGEGGETPTPPEEPPAPTGRRRAAATTGDPA